MVVGVTLRLDTVKYYQRSNEMNPKIDDGLLGIKDTLLYLEQRYNGDNDIICDGNYPMITYGDEVLLTCLLKQNAVIRLLAEELDKLKRSIRQ